MCVPKLHLGYNKKENKINNNIQSPQNNMLEAQKIKQLTP